MADYRKLLEQEILKAQQADPAQAQLEQEIMRSPSGAQNIAPTLGLIDHFTGTNFASQVPKPETTKEKLAQLLQLRQGANQAKLGGLSQLAKMQMAQADKAEDRAFKQQMFGMQSALAKAKMAKALGAPKLGSEDKQKLGYTTTLLKEAPKLMSMYQQGTATVRPGIVGSLMGQNDTEVLINALAENYGRLQSGGAISKDEEDRFKSRLGSVMDAPKVRMAKLKQIMEEIQDKHNLYGGGSYAAPASRMPSSGIRSQSSGLDVRNLNVNDLSDEELLAMPDEAFL